MPFLIDGRLLYSPSYDKPAVFEEMLPQIGNDYGVTVACDNAKVVLTATLRQGQNDCFTLAELQEIIDVMEGPPGTLLVALLDHNMIPHTGVITSFTYSPVEGVSDQYVGVSLSIRKI